MAHVGCPPFPAQCSDARVMSSCPLWACSLEAVTAKRVTLILFMNDFTKIFLSFPSPVVFHICTELFFILLLCAYLVGTENEIFSGFLRHYIGYAALEQSHI